MSAELSESFYVGDAAGRKHDFADSDKCALPSTCKMMLVRICHRCRTQLLSIAEACEHGGLQRCVGRWLRVFG